MKTAFYDLETYYDPAAKYDLKSRGSLGYIYDAQFELVCGTVIIDDQHYQAWGHQQTIDLLRTHLTGNYAVAHNGIEFDHQPQTSEFVISDDVMKAFREYMTDFIAKNQDYGLTMKMVDDHQEWLRAKIREEVLIAAYGVDTQKRMTAEQDSQLQRALAEMANSSQLAEKARRLSKASKK